MLHVGVPKFVQRLVYMYPGVLCYSVGTYNKLTIGMSSATLHIRAAREHCKTGCVRRDDSSLAEKSYYSAKKTRL